MGSEAVASAPTVISLERGLVVSAEAQCHEVSDGVCVVGFFLNFNERVFLKRQAELPGLVFSQSSPCVPKPTPDIYRLRGF